MNPLFRRLYLELQSGVECGWLDKFWRAFPAISIAIKGSQLCPPLRNWCACLTGNICSQKGRSSGYRIARDHVLHWVQCDDTD